MHHALKWSDKEFIIKEKAKDGTWDMNVYQSLTNSNRLDKSLKRKVPELLTIDKETNFKMSSKKIKLCPLLSENWNTQPPLGLTWDKDDYSCAYDSLFTVLYHIWTEGQIKHRTYFEKGTNWIQILHTHFISLLNKTCTFESIRDQLRTLLNHANPLEYRYGKNYTDINQLVGDLILTKSYTTSHLQCLNCKFSSNTQLRYLQDYTAVG